jgi:MGT family glycosyltransferase
VGFASAARPLLPQGARLFALEEEICPAAKAQHEAKLQEAQRRGSLAALQFLYEDLLLPIARAMLPGLERAVEDYRPDGLAVDLQAFAGAVVARQRGVPWASLATTSASVMDPFAALPKLQSWQRSLLAELQREAGLAPCVDAEFSPQLVLVFSSAALVGSERSFPAHYHFVGPSLSHRPSPTDFPWEALKDVPRVLVSLGTLNAQAGRRFFEEVFTAVEGRPLQAIVVAQEDHLARAVSALPPNVLLRSYVPQLALLKRMQAVICHGGHNTVVESLVNGLPLVLAPIKDDQSMVAEQVVKAGAGIRLKFRRATSVDIAHALERVLGDPAFKEAAKKIRLSLLAAGGAARAATLLEGLIAKSPKEMPC